MRAFRIASESSFRPTEEVNLSEYALTLCIDINDQYHPLTDATFFFGFDRVAPPAFIFVFTGPGDSSVVTPPEFPERAARTLLYWGRNVAWIKASDGETRQFQRGDIFEVLDAVPSCHHASVVGICRHIRSCRSLVIACASGVSSRKPFADVISLSE
jgi:hypothetical protein